MIHIDTPLKHNWASLVPYKNVVEILGNEYIIPNYVNSVNDLLVMAKYSSSASAVPTVLEMVFGIKELIKLVEGTPFKYLSIVSIDLDDIEFYGSETQDVSGALLTVKVA